MKPSDIKEHHIYCNRGKGKVLRFVLSIGKFTPPDWFSSNPRDGEPGVWYRDSKGRQDVLYLSSFASWCGKCVAIADGESFTMVDHVDFKLLEAFKDI